MWLHTLKHGVEDVLPSGGTVQWNKLEKLLINLKGSSDSERKTPAARAREKLRRHRNELQQVLVSRSHSDISSMRRQTVRGERLTLSEAERFSERIYHNHDALLDTSPSVNGTVYRFLDQKTENIKKLVKQTHT